MRAAHIGVAALAAVLLAGCGESSSQTPRFVTPSAVGASASTDPSGAAGTLSWPHGVVTTTFDRADSFLSVADPLTGAEQLRVGLPTVKEHFWSRTSFSADWSQVAWATGKGPVVLHVAELLGTRYVESVKWELPGSKRHGSVKMLAAFIGETTRVWTGWYTAGADVQLFSVDARQPDAPPRREKGDSMYLDSRGRSAAEKTVSVTNRPSWGGVLHRTKDQAFYAVVQSDYTCDVPVTALVLACWGRGDFGAIATLTAHGAGGRITMRKLAPTSIGRPVDMVASPDGATVLFRVPKDSWYAVPADGSAAPDRRFADLEIGYAPPIDWI